MSTNTDNQNDSVVKLSDAERSELHGKVLKRFQIGSGANELNRRNATADKQFIWGADLQSQWDPAVLQLRQGRPSYTFNRVLQPVNNLCGEQRQTRPAVKVRPASENATTEVSEIFAGLWRSIEVESRAEAVYDEAFKHAVGGGWGELLIMPEYANDQSFDQVLRIRSIPNPETVVRDPESTDPCGADAKWVMVGSRISEEEFKELYPGLDPATFPMSRDSLGWRSDGMVRVVDYFERVAIETEIAELSDSRVIEYTAGEKKIEKALDKAGLEEGKAARVVRTRKVKKHKIRWTKVDGARILEGPVDYDWQRIPVVRMPGRYMNIEGRQILQSLVRHSWDAQRAYNFQASDAIERSALVPKARYFVTGKMINGYERIWNSSNSTPRIYMPYNVDKDAPNGGAPVREQPIDVPAGAVALAQQAAGDIQATIGVFNPSLGNTMDMDRMSGKALVGHTQRGDLGTHEFVDNYGKALQLLCEIGMDMIPTTYDSARIIRIINGDGKEAHVGINQPGDGGKLVNSLKEGRYDCVVTLGPAYQTQRQESLDTMLEAIREVPLFGQVAPDLIAKLIDLPENEELVKRMRGMLIKQGVIPPTTQQEAATAQPQQPNPMQEAELARAQALARKDSAAAALQESKVQHQPLELRKMMAALVREEMAAILDARKAHTSISEANTAITDAAGAGT